MSFILIIIAIVTLLAAVAAMSFRNLVHCALMLAVTFSGIAALYLELGAEFAGFTQILVYVGAVAILVVMAILLTRSGEAPEKSVLTSGWFAGVAVTAMVFTLIAFASLTSTALPKGDAPAPVVTVKDIGNVLMNRYVLPLEVIGLLLTAAMIGAVVIALKEDDKSAPVPTGNPQSAIPNKKEGVAGIRCNSVSSSRPCCSPPDLPAR